MLKNYPHWKENPLVLHNLKEAITMEDMVGETHQIYATLDNHQADHQSTIVEVGGKIVKKSISFFIDPWSTHNYVSPKVAKSCSLGKMKHNKAWLVQLATWTNRKVSEVVMDFPIDFNGLLIKTNLNVLPLTSYKALIGMDWMEKHRANADCYENFIECIDEKGQPRMVRGIPKKFSVR